MSLPKIQTLQTTGDISVQPVTDCIPNDPYPSLYLIMGPTGAGKSSFIEALAGECQKLSISKNQLAGFTQRVNAYRLVNVVSTIMSTIHPVYLIDTPGFSDLKISEIAIMNMVKEWLKENELEYVDGILFLTPVTDTRLPGSRRRTIAMLKQLLAPTHNLGAVIFVTTMWDTLHNEHTRKRAESNFEQLKDGVCKDFSEEQRFKEPRFEGQSIYITRFMNTKSSALEAMNSVWDIVRSFSQSEMSVSPNLYRDLHDRIEGAIRTKQMIESELAQPEAQANSELRVILEQNQMENHETLMKFIAQLANFGPIPKGLEGAHQHLQSSILAMQHAPPPILANISLLSEEGPLHMITTTPDDPSTAQATNKERSSARPGPTPGPESSPTSIVQLHPTRMLTLKGLLRRLIQAAKRSEMKWFRKDED